MPTIVHFDIASDDVSRARRFYETLFAWTFLAPPGIEGYYLIETKDTDGKDAVGGGLGQRGAPGQAITAYFGVEDIDAYLAKVTELGGSAPMPKMAVPGWGYLATCVDTEGNAFGCGRSIPVRSKEADMAWKKTNQDLIDRLGEELRGYDAERRFMFGSPTLIQ